MPKDLDNLAKQISQARDKGSEQQTKPAASMLGMAYRLMVEVIAGIGVGGFVGWWLDKWLSTAPWFMLSLLFVGLLAGILGSVRAVAQMRRKLD